MKTSTAYIQALLLLILGFNFGYGQGKRNNDANTHAWKYEIEGIGTGVQGSYQVKIWSIGSFQEAIIEQAKKNAVHAIIFKGFPDNNRVKGQKPLATNPNLEQEQLAFFDEFFLNGGKYLKFVSLLANGSILPEDRIKLGKFEYKIGVIVSVNSAELRKDLENAGIIKGLTTGF